MKQLLINREWDVPGNWYAPSRKLEEYSSVVKVELTNTCSSAGDWDGLFIQKIGKTHYVIPFSQENNYPGSGFTLYTGNVFVSHRHNLQDLNAFMEEASQLFYDFYCR